jgi:hypothetical protein
MSETQRRLNLAPRAPLDLTVLNSPNNAVGPRSWTLSSFHASGKDGVASCVSKLRWVKRRDDSIGCHASSKSDGPKLSRRCYGPQVLDALVTSRIRDMRELLLVFRSCDGRNAETTQLGATRPPNLMVLNSPDAAMGPRSCTLSLLRTSRI